MTEGADYRALAEATVAPYLTSVPGLPERLGGAPDDWAVREVGDGNLNLVFLVDGPRGSVCVKQALPYVRLVGPSWPMPVERAFFEHTCLVQHGAHVGRLMPEVFHYDPVQFTIVMEKLSPHVIVRRGMIDGVVYPKLAQDVAEYCAQSLYHTSALHLSAPELKARMGVFCANTELCKITEDLIFTDPYRTHDRNRWTSPQLDPIKLAIEGDVPLKTAISRLKRKFVGSPEALIHGDLHTGSLMATPEETRIIDPEFAFYGPMGFDLGAVIGNLLINYFAQDGHAAEGRASQTPRDQYQEWVLDQVVGFWTRFRARFLELWRADGAGDVYSADLFRGPEAEIALEAERQAHLNALWADALGFGGAKMTRRILGLAHNIDLDWIESPDLRAACERRCLALARRMVVETGSFGGPEALVAAARAIREG